MAEPAPPNVASITAQAPPPPPGPGSQPANMGPPGVMMVPVPVQMVGPISTHMICPNCHNEIYTIVRTSPSMMAYFFGGMLCFIGCWFGCCLIPCFMEDCQDANHSCPVCGIHLGTFRR